MRSDELKVGQEYEYFSPSHGIWIHVVYDGKNGIYYEFFHKDSKTYNIQLTHGSVGVNIRKLS